MRKLRLSDTIELLRNAEDLDDIMAAMEASFEDLGFPQWGYTCQMLESYVTSPVYVLTNLSHEFMTEYLAMGYHDADPLIKYCPNNNLPWIWSVEDDWSKFGDDTSLFMQAIKRHGYTGGLCIPIFSAQNTRGFIDLVSRDPTLADMYEALEGRAAQITLILRYVQDEILRIATKNNENIYENPLSNRQKEVLLWVGEGLTSKEIAEKMGISFRTVESYIVEIQNKLDVSNRQQAVTRAVSLGYILPLSVYDPLRMVNREIKLVLSRKNSKSWA
jgi:LuxR family transcriptional regulator